MRAQTTRVSPSAYKVRVCARACSCSLCVHDEKWASVDTRSKEWCLCRIWSSTLFSLSRPTAICLSLLTFSLSRPTKIAFSLSRAAMTTFPICCSPYAAPATPFPAMYPVPFPAGGNMTILPLVSASMFTPVHTHIWIVSVSCSWFVSIARAQCARHQARAQTHHRRQNARLLRFL